MLLKDKTAIITGSARGIGRGIAFEYSKEGADVVITDLDLESCLQTEREIKKEYGTRTLAVACDVSKEDQVRNMIRETVNHFGKLDIIVNNAGIYPFKSLLELTVEEWDAIHAVNTRGVFLCTREAAKAMVETGKGKIINLSSVASTVGMPMLTHYSSSKGGVNAFTRGAAIELADKNINVNAIAAGAIDSSYQEGSQVPTDKKDVPVSFVPPIPMKRMGVPKDIANMAVFLASDKADYITGQIIVIDGGWKSQ